MYMNTYFALVNEYMELRLNGFTTETALQKLRQIVIHVEELDEGVYMELERLCKGIERYGQIKP